VTVEFQGRKGKFPGLYKTKVIFRTFQGLKIYGKIFQDFPGFLPRVMVCLRKFLIVRFNVGACCVSPAADEEMMSELLRYQGWAAEGYGDDKRKHEKRPQ